MKFGDFDFKTILGFDVINVPFETFLRPVLETRQTKVVINTISPNSFGLATKDDEFGRALQQSILVLDGVYFALASIVKGRGSVVKNQGPEISKLALQAADRLGLKVFFLGSTPATLEGIARHLEKNYPRVQTAFHSPPFKEVLSGDDNAVIFEKINAFQPDLLFIGMTCPKQEKWIIANRDRIEFRVSLSVGAVFDWLAGNYKEIAPIWWRLNLGWLVRALQRPSLIRRNTPNYWIFFKHMVRSLFA